MNNNNEKDQYRVAIFEHRHVNGRDQQIRNKKGHLLSSRWKCKEITEEIYSENVKTDRESLHLRARLVHQLSNTKGRRELFSKLEKPLDADGYSVCAFKNNVITGIYNLETLKRMLDYLSSPNKVRVFSLMKNQGVR